MGKLYACTEDISETDMIQYLVEKNISINKDECHFPPRFNKQALRQCFNHHNAQPNNENINDELVTNQFNPHWSSLDAEIENAERYVEKLKQARRERDKLVLKTLDVNEMNQLLDS